MTPEAMFAATEQRQLACRFRDCSIDIGEVKLPTDRVWLDKCVIDAHLHAFDPSIKSGSGHSRSVYSDLASVSCITAAPPQAMPSNNSGGGGPAVPIST